MSKCSRCGLRDIVCKELCIRCYQNERYRTNEKWRNSCIKRFLKRQKEHPEKVKEIDRKSSIKYHGKNKEKHKESMRRYYNNNKKTWKDYYQKNKVIIIKRSTVNYHREKILKYFNNQCNKCNSKENLEIHHKDYDWDKNTTPKDRLMNNIHKLVLLCRDCHRKIHRISKSDIN